MDIRHIGLLLGLGWDGMGYALHDCWGSFVCGIRLTILRTGIPLARYLYGFLPDGL